MATQVVKVGTKIKHTLFGGTICEGVVNGIEKCKYGEKYGKAVKTMKMSDKSRCYVLDIDNGHWCYGDQVVEIIK